MSPVPHPDTSWTLADSSPPGHFVPVSGTTQSPAANRHHPKPYFVFSPMITASLSNSNILLLAIHRQALISTAEFHLFHLQQAAVEATRILNGVRALGINPSFRAVTPGHPAAGPETRVLPDPGVTPSKSELSSLISDPSYHSASEAPFLPLNSSDNICSRAARIKQERTKNRNNFFRR